jgi:FlaA1/EpsC-like NDP-sugar epimerase
MTISEAAQLIIQAGAMGQGDEIFILEMGTPVRIADMARDLIKLSGKEPDRDVQIIFTGLREGEKLFEELITSGEGIVETGHKQILVLRSDGSRNGDIAAFRHRMDEDLSLLYDAAKRHDADSIKRILKQLVPEYTPSESKSIF